MSDEQRGIPSKKFPLLELLIIVFFFNTWIYIGGSLNHEKMRVERNNDQKFSHLKELVMILDFIGNAHSIIINAD